MRAPAIRAVGLAAAIAAGVVLPAPPPAQAQSAPAAAASPTALSAQQAAALAATIVRQVQPCADRLVNPGPGAERIRVTVGLELNRDGSLARLPRIIGHDGVDETNRRYVGYVDDAVLGIFTGCTPLRGLPEELYDVPQGWKTITLRYRLRT